MPNITITKYKDELPDDLYQFIDGNSDSNLAHSLAWHEAFSKSYGHKPVFGVARDDGKCVGFLPTFWVKRPVLGSVMTSMPFLDYGGPCSESSEISSLLLQELIKEAKERGCNDVEIRSRKKLALDATENLDKVTMILDLPSDSETLWKALNAKVRNQVRKAEKNDLSVHFGGIELLKDFYHIWAINMRDLGSPPHALSFFKEILKAFNYDACIALINKENKAIGGLVALKYNNSVVVPWASSLRDYFKLCPNMLLYWETIKKSCDEGYEKFDFGRSTKDVGTYKFKKQWGAEAHQLFWYTIPLRSKSESKNGQHKNGGLAVEVWKRLPVPVSNSLGPKVRKYLTQ